MWTVAVVVGLSIAWFGAQKMYEGNASLKNRRLRSSFAWSILGAIFGSFFGVAGFGSAIAGTIPGAIVGFLLTGYVMKEDRAETATGPMGIGESSLQNPPSGNEFKTLTADYSERVRLIESQFRDGLIALVQGDHATTLDLASAERLAEAREFGSWAPGSIVAEFERQQTWWYEPDEDDKLSGSVSTFFSLKNTSEKPVAGLILKFTNEGWVPIEQVGHSYSVITFSEQLMPNARAIIATQIPLNLPWQPCVGKGATGDIVAVWYAQTA